MTTNQSQVPVKAGNRNDIATLLQSDHVRDQVTKALPKFMDPERMLRVMLTTVNRTPALQQCTKQSLLSALMVCTQAGLEPDGRHAHLIPYKDQVQVIFDYKGLIAIASRNGVKNIRSMAVCENDEFSFEIENGQTKVKHVINFREQRGKPVAYYSVCQRDGETDYEVMTVEEIELIRERSRASKSGPWVTDPGEMCKKTVLRRHSKRWPMIAEFVDMADDDVPGDRFTPKAPEFSSRPLKSSSMDFLNSPAGTLTDAPAVPMGEDNEEKLAEAGLAPVTKIGSQEHTDFEAWMHTNGILFSQLAEIPELGIDEYPSLRDIPAARIRTLGLAKADILAAAKGVKA